MHDNFTVVASVVCAIFASGGFWQFLQMKIQKKHPLTKAAIKPLEKAILAILRDRLLYLLTTHAEDESLEADEFENLNSLYEAYTALDGNGTIKRLYEQLVKRVIIK